MGIPIDIIPTQCYSPSHLGLWNAQKPIGAMPAYTKAGRPSPAIIKPIALDQDYASAAR
jgi:hypothetical protein